MYLRPMIGSPPLAWGIPAETPVKEALAEVHPHSHGEYVTKMQLIMACLGSPPLAWGIPPINMAQVSSGRFTPTRMGNTG